MKLTSEQFDTLSGVVLILGMVYDRDYETLAEDVVGAFNADELLYVAKAINDPCLQRLKMTIGEYRRKSRRLRRCPDVSKSAAAPPSAKPPGTPRTAD